MPPTRLARALAPVLCAALALGAAACGGDPATGLSGDIVIDGSSTVAPLTSAAAEGFNLENRGVDLEVRTSGTGGGFQVFCEGETEISNASRRIRGDERARCERNGVRFEEFRVASDGITLVTKEGAGARIGRTCLTVAQLREIWRQGSRVRRWSDLGEGFRDVPMALAGPGSESGTYDFFNEAVLAGEGGRLRPRQDYSASEDDNVTVRAVASAEAALGYLGYSWYSENAERLDALEVDAGGGCVAPTEETIASGEYPLSRPLLIYVNREALERPHVREFVRWYLANAVRLAREQEYVPAPREALDEALARVPA